jgi:CRP/FNR family transcriptional regulator, cyclic AMP receptor protein
LTRGAPSIAPRRYISESRVGDRVWVWKLKNNSCAMTEDALLTAVDILEDLPQSEVDYLATCSQVVRLSKQESLTLGEDLHGILFLVSGLVRVHEPAFKGQDLTFSVAEGATVVGQPGSALRPSRTLRIEAFESSVLRTLGWEDFEELVLRNPKVGLKTIRLLGERLEAYEGRLSELIRKEVPARLAGLILRLSEREGAAAVDDRRIPTRYTHQQLASMVGSNREAVTRAMGVLRKAGAVQTRHRQIYVTDEDALEYFAGVVR